LVELINVGQNQERLFGLFLKTEEERLITMFLIKILWLFQAGNSIGIGLQISKILRKVKSLGHE
jgi:hypothetical protein